MALGRIATELVKKLGTETVEEVAPKIPLPKAEQGLGETVEPAAQIAKPKRTSTIGRTADEVLTDRVSDIKKDRQRAGYEYQNIKIDNPPIEGEATLTQAEKVTREAINEKKRNLYLRANTLKKEQEITNIVKAQKEKGINGMDAAMDLIAVKLGVGRPFSNIEGRTKSIYNKISAPMHDLRDALRTKVVGLKQDVKLADDIVRFLKDGKTKDPANMEVASKLAKQWEEAALSLKTMRNKAGARIGTLEDWIIPQSHSKEKLLKAGYKKWTEYIKPKLDSARIETEQDKTLDEILKGAYDAITQVKIVQAPGKGQLAKQGEFERILHFKNGDGMVDYKNIFGNPDTFSTMDTHIRQQSNEIATMQIFGANPEANFLKLKELARADRSMGKWDEQRLDDQWATSTGKADGDSTVNKFDRGFAAVMAGHRSIQVASKLGTAQVSAIGDLATIILGAGYRNLSSIKIIGKGLHTLLQESVSGGTVSQNAEKASRIGVVSEFASGSIANSRYAEVSTGFLQRRATNVIRASGLAAWTDSFRVGFGMELAGNLSEDFGKSFDKIKYKSMLEEYGINAKEWDIIRSTKPREVIGNNGRGGVAKFADLKAISSIDEELGYRVSEMITAEMDAFIIAPTDRTRRLSTGGATKGTLKGEFRRTFMTFKSFPVTMAMLHINRMGTMSKTGKAAYTGAVIASSTIMGGVALFAYDLVTGKTPRDPFRKSFPVEALLKGGGGGIYIDLLLGSDLNKYGHDLETTLLGVSAGTFKDIVDTVYEGVALDEKFIPNTYNRAVNYIPGQNLWYTRLLMERTIGDAMGEIIDPDRQKNIRKREKWMRTTGQKALFEDTIFR